ncbi:MAG: hypothetical protein EP145_14945 [Bacteroides uniformis]|nr:hypothetical protein [Bacteroides uniformis]
MAEQDIKENEMTPVSSVDYVRGLKGKDSVLITPSSLMTQRGILHTSLSYILKVGALVLIMQSPSGLMWLIIIIIPHQKVYYSMLLQKVEGDNS